MRSSFKTYVLLVILSGASPVKAQAPGSQLASGPVNAAIQAQPPATAAPSSQPQGAVTLSGIKLLPEAEVKQALGPAPALQDPAWAEAARQRVQTLCRDRGYTHARLWITPPDPARRTPWVFHLDEGRMERILYFGVGAFRGLLLQVDVYLPHKILHRPTLETALERLRAKYSFSNVYYRVVEEDVLVSGPTGEPTHNRDLRIYIIQSESYGWGFGLDFSSTFGFIPSSSFAHKGLFRDDDRVELELGISVPFRRYFMDEDPSFQWVHGAFALSYRPLKFFYRRFAPVLDSRTEVSRYQRRDVALDIYHLWETDALLNISTDVTSIFKITSGLGVDALKVFGLTPMEQAADPDGAAPAPDVEATTHVSLVARLKADLDFTSRTLRRDLQTYLHSAARLDYNSQDLWVVRGELEGQYVRNFGFHNLILHGKAQALFGEVRFWNEDPLSDYLRVFFENRYWVRQAAELDLAFRLSVVREAFKVGVFHDLAVFGDRTGAEPRAALANAFGPSLHFLLFDTFACDLFYGFGFSPSIFSHNIHLEMTTIF